MQATVSKKITKGFIAILLGTVTSTLVFATLTPLLVRIIGSSGYGQYAFALAIFNIINISLSVGTKDACRKYIAEEPGNQQRVNSIATATLATSLLLTLPLITLTFILLNSNLLANSLSIGMATNLKLILLAVIFAQLMMVCIAILYGLHKEPRAEIANISALLIFAVAGVVMAYKLGPSGIFIGLALGYSVGALLAFLSVRKKVKFEIFKGLHHLKKYGRKITTFGLFSFVLSFLTMTLFYADVVMVKYFINYTQTGYYKAALQLAEFMWFLPIALQLVLLHSVSQLWKKNDIGQINKITSHLVKYVTMATALISILVYLFADQIFIYYFTPEFVAAKPALFILLPGVLGFSVARVIYPVTQAKGEMRLLLKATGTCVLLNIVLNWFLIPTYGIKGAAIATSISYGLMAFLHGIAANKAGFNPFLRFPIIKILFVILISIISALFFSHFVANKTIRLFISPVIATSAFVLSSYRLSIITVRELKDIYESLPDQVKAILSYIFRLPAA